MKKFFLIFAVLFAISLSSALLVFWISLSAKNLSLDQLKWKTAPPIIAYNDVERENNSGLLFLRLSDGKEQFIAGIWNTFFLSSLEVMTLGEFPSGYSSSTGQHLYIVGAGQRIQSVSLDHFKERVSSVQINKNGAYLLFRTQDNEKTGFCISEWQKSAFPDCKPINVPEITNMIYDPSSDRIAIAQNASGTLYQIDPWNDGIVHPKILDSDKDAEKINAMNKIFAQNVNNRSDITISTDPQIFVHVFGLALIHKGDIWSVHRIPQASSLTWLDDGEHLLVTQTNQLSVYEIKTRSTATLLSDNDIGSKFLFSYRDKTNPAL